MASLVLHVYKFGDVPPCLNADEAAFGYNAYSIATTGRDEHGNLLPLRLLSFGDYKLPLYSYLSIPAVKLFGLSVSSTRALNIIVGVALVPTVFLVGRSLFGNVAIALIAAFLSSVTPWIFILTRQAHEAVLGAELILLALLLLLRYKKNPTWFNLSMTSFFALLSTFAYHTGRIFFVFIMLYELYLLFRYKTGRKSILAKSAQIAILVAILVAPFLVDMTHGASRLQNLIYYKNKGFELRINEYIGEHPLRAVHNKALESIREVSNRYLSQLSPEFAVAGATSNLRFGFENLGLITPVEYVLFFIGLYYLFHNKEKERYLIMALMFLAPLGGALTWQPYVLSRSYFMIFPMIFIVSYGAYHIFVKSRTSLFLRNGVLGFSFLYLFFLGTNWDLYFYHYPKRAVVQRAWQCGYGELNSYIRDNYDRFDRFVITARHGQPYIFTLFHLDIDPARYHGTARLSPPDEYGFTQVESFDKFDFTFTFNPESKNTAYIGFPDQFDSSLIDQNKIKKIKVGNDEVFWIYET